MEDTTGKQMHLSRHERRQQMRAERSLHGGVSRMRRRLALWGGALFLLALVGWGMVKLSASVSVPTGDGTLVDSVTERDNSLGPADAPVTLVEYSDFQCPACGAFFPVVKQVLAESQLKDKVRFVYRSFPLTLIHANAELAARAAQSAAVQGKFWEMHDALFEGQSVWAKLSSTDAREAFAGYARGIGLDVDAFTTALDSTSVRNAVQEQSDGARRSGVNSTPTFFINGKQMPQPSSYDAFRQFLIDALNANP